MVSHDESIKHSVDAISIAAVAGALMDWLPPIAALLTIIWTALRIYESPTVTGWIERRNKAKEDATK